MLNDGEKVRVKSFENLTKNRFIDQDGAICFGDVFFIEEMKKYCEKEVTINELLCGNKDDAVYEITEDDGEFRWMEEMFDTK